MVRAHPTVPILTPLNCRFNSNCFQAAATSVLWRAAHPCLRIWIPSPTILPNFALGERMWIFRARHFQFGLLLAVALSISPAAAQTYTPEQEQACTGDAFRLCSAAIPDVNRVTACMVAKQDQLSPPCRVYFRSDPEPSAAAPRPATPRKAASTKTRKAKKPAKPAS